MDDFSVFLPIEKVDAQSGMVWGYASTPSKDLQGEIVPLDAIKAALPDYMKWANIREMHTNSAVGVTKEARVDAKGLYIGAKISDPAAWRKCVDKVYKGFSIGGSKLEKVGDVVKALSLREISLVDRPANSECSIDICKIAGGLAFGGSMENQTSNETLMEKALDTFRTILGMGKIALPDLAKAAQDPNLSPAESEELTADEMATLTAKFAEGVDLEKREFSEKERKHLGSTGVALPDGSFPIQTVKDLENAIQAHGRASDPEKAKDHIVARAKALNATHLLPTDWPGSTKKKESTIMDTDLQKRFTAASKAAIKKADDHIKKASASHGKAVDELEALHKCMGKAADGGDEFKKHLTALSGHMNDIADHHELAHAALGKAMTGWDGEKAETDLGEEPASENVEELSPRRMTEGEVEGNTFRGAGDSPYSAAAIATMVKAAVAEATAPLIADNAFLKGQMSVIENQPSAGRRPKLFVASSTGDVFPASDGKADFNRMINKSLSEADPNDQRSSEQATARAFGLMCTPGSGFAKSINDPNFKIDLGGN
jgi:hypothetical protein